jgi:hypothetical protein
VEFQTEDARTRLRAEIDGPLSPKDFRSALDCSFQFAARRALTVSPEGSEWLWYSLRKLPQQIGLWNQPSALSAKADFQVALDNWFERHIQELEAWEIPMFRAGAERMIAGWVQREFLARELWPRELVRTNVSFGEDPLPRSRCNIELKGSVGAVSVIEGAPVIHIVDRAIASGTRNSNIDLTTRENIHFGVLFVSIYKRGQSAAIEIETPDDKRQLVILGDDLRVPQRPQLTTLRVYDDPLGSPKGLAREKFETAFREAAENVKSKMKTGSIKPEPSDSCQFCRFGELCRRSLEFGEQPFKWADD